MRALVFGRQGVGPLPDLRPRGIAERQRADGLRHGRISLFGGIRHGARIHPEHMLKTFAG